MYYETALNYYRRALEYSVYLESEQINYVNNQIMLCEEALGELGD
jgi:hypothetical protein